MLFEKHVKGLGDDLYRPLFHTAAVAYGRPFSGNKPHGALDPKWAKFDDPLRQQTHDLLIEARNTYVAHSDEGVRKVEIFPDGTPIPGGGGAAFVGLSIGVTTKIFPPELFG